MNLSDLLNADMQTLGRLGRQGFDWWLAQLRDMLPAAFAPGSKRLAAFHRLGADNAIIAASTPGTDTLVIPGEACLVRHLVLPRMSDGDLRGAVELDLDRIMPVAPDSIIFGLRNCGPSVREGMIDVVVGALPLQQAQNIAARLAETGITPRHIGPLGDGGERLAFDLAPAMRQAGLLPAQRPVALVWWGAVALLLACNLGFSILRDGQEIARIQGLIDAQAPALMTVQKVESRLRGNAALVNGVRARREHQQPLRILAEVQRLLPGDAWVQRFEWDGTQMRLSGFAPNSTAIVTALKSSSGFSAVRASRAEVMAETVTGKPFDLTARTAKPK